MFNPFSISTSETIDDYSKNMRYSRIPCLEVTSVRGHRVIRELQVFAADLLECESLGAEALRGAHISRGGGKVRMNPNALKASTRGAREGISRSLS